MVYSISQVMIAIKSLHEIQQLVSFAPFEVYGIKEDYLAELVPVMDIEKKGETIAECIDYSVTKENGEYIRYFYHSKFEDVIYARSKWDWINKRIIVEYIPCYKEYLSQSGNAFFHIGLEQIMLREQRLIFHAACVETAYGGILFTGPAGAGKSTQADLWIKHRHAFLINGDRPILSVDDSGWKAWGSPYAGSSRCYVNKHCAVKAIARVAQDSENRIIRLKGSRAFSTVFSGVTVNDWSREDVNMASELVIQLINTVPVYEMHCTNTEEAVEVLEKVLKGEVNG